MGPVSLKQALFWMNIHLELLAVNQKALGRMRTLAAASGSFGGHEVDVQLVTTEIERVMRRLKYWEDVVDRANGRQQAV
jgi:hypothetical protein